MQNHAKSCKFMLYNFNKGIQEVRTSTSRSKITLDWEENLRQSKAYEHLAIEAESYQLPEAPRLFRLAAEAVQACLDNIPDAHVQSEQVVRAVKLFLKASKPTQAKVLAQLWVSNKNLLQQALNELYNSIPNLDLTVINSRTPIDTDLSVPINYSSEIVTSTERDILRNVANDILALPEPDMKVICAHALAASILLDIDHDPPRPYSPRQIAEEFGVRLEVQRELGICLTKESALEFLERLRIAPKKGSFYRRLSDQGYRYVFDRAPSSIGKKPLVFTYAEILHFEDITFRLQFPPVLQHLLD